MLVVFALFSTVKSYVCSATPGSKIIFLFSSWDSFKVTFLHLLDQLLISLGKDKYACNVGVKIYFQSFVVLITNL